jgi:hypothetical protein
MIQNRIVSLDCGLGVAPNSKVTVEQLIAFKPTNLLEGSIHLIAAGTEHSISLCTGQKVMYVLERTLAERMDASRLPRDFSGIRWLAVGREPRRRRRRSMVLV